MRLPDWDIRLNNYIKSKMKTPFKWGLNDCAIFSIGAIESVIGTAPELPEYSSRKEAVLTLRNMQASSLKFAVSNLLKTKQVARGEIGRGYLVLYQMSGRTALAVSAGIKAFAPGKNGLMIIPPRLFLEGWKIE